MLTHQPGIEYSFTGLIVLAHLGALGKSGTAMTTTDCALPWPHHTGQDPTFGTGKRGKNTGLPVINIKTKVPRKRVIQTGNLGLANTHTYVHVHQISHLFNEQ